MVPSASMRGVVAGHGVALAVDDRKRLRRLLRVLEVAERHVAGARQPAGLGAAALERGAQVVLQHQRVLVHA